MVGTKQRGLRMRSKIKNIFGCFAATIIILVYLFVLTLWAYAVIPPVIDVTRSMIIAMTTTTFSYTYDTATPAGTDDPREADDRMREIKAAVQERLNVEHVFDLTGTEVSHADSGQHTDINCTSITNAGILTNTGSVTNSSTTEMTGNVTVNSNKVTIAAATGNTVVAGTLTSTGVATLADASKLATAAAPTDPCDIANMQYVDDAITAGQDPTYSGGESHTFNGGLITKMGYVTRTGSSTPVSFATAFPGGIVSVTASPVRTTYTYASTLASVSTTGFTIKSAGNETGHYWIAIGY